MPRSDQEPDLDEESPLITAQNTQDDEDVLEDPLAEPLGLEDSFVETKSVWYLILLTLSVGGLQIVWSVELSNGSPYLLSLGMSKALVAFVWLAGPLTGVLVQPYIGMISDRSRMKWGRRRPFMIAGTLGTVISSLILSYAKDITWVLGPWSNQQKYEGAWKGLTIALATVMMWCLDFSINTVQAAIRAFIVDGAPAHQQEAANGWASRVIGVGNVTGYIFGFLNLPRYFSFFGNTQFKVLCVIASIALSSTVLLSSATIKEHNPQDDPPTRDDYQSAGFFGFFRQIFVAIKRLTPMVRSVCEIQFVHWLAWFPFLFYITTYIGQLYVDPRLRPDMTDEEVDALWDNATRIGTLALLVQAIVSFVANVVLPVLVVPSYKAPTTALKHEIVRPVTPSSPIGHRDREPSWTESAFHRSASNTSLRQSNSNELGNKESSMRKPSLLQRMSVMLQIPGFTLRRAWMMAQILHAICMFSTFFISNTLVGTIMVGCVGLVWSLSLWAPFALISADIAKRHELRRTKQRQKLINGDGSAAAEGDGDLSKLEEEEDRAGIILGLHNVAVSAPQVVSTLVCSIIFKFLQKDRSTPGDVSVAWTLRISGIAALGAAFLTWRMKEASEEENEK